MRLIDADALKKKKVRSTERCEWVVPVKEIDWMPTIEPEPKTGKWIKIKNHHYGTYHDFDYYTIRCSVCGDRPEKAWHLTPFCPNCGSRMLEEGGEDD